MKTYLENIKNKQSLRAIALKASPILKKAGVTRAALFGSSAREETREDSDVDILVELPKERSLFDFIELQQRLEAALNKKVDLGEYSTIKPRLKEYILGDAVQII